MRLYWIREGPNPIPYKKRETGTQTEHTQGGRHVRTEAEEAVMQPQPRKAGDPLVPPEATKRQEGTPRASRGSEGQLTP